MAPAHRNISKVLYSEVWNSFNLAIPLPHRDLYINLFLHTWKGILSQLSIRQAYCFPFKCGREDD